jgi:hypothetical protein
MHLFSASLETPTVSKPHILMTRAAAVGLVRLAQQTARAGGLRAFAFVIHEVSVDSVVLLSHLACLREGGELIVR